MKSNLEAIKKLSTKCCCVRTIEIRIKYIFFKFPYKYFKPSHSKQVEKSSAAAIMLYIKMESERTKGWIGNYNDKTNRKRKVPEIPQTVIETSQQIKIISTF